MLSESDWPVDIVLSTWNVNGTNTLDRGCGYGSIIIEETNTDEWWGRTYFDGVTTTVSVSTQVPLTHRQHVLCHELGHVLGIGHPDNKQSCMDVNSYHPTPSRSDLEEVSEFLYDPWVAACKAVEDVSQCQ